MIQRNPAKIKLSIFKRFVKYDFTVKLNNTLDDRE